MARDAFGSLISSTTALTATASGTITGGWIDTLGPGTPPRGLHFNWVATLFGPTSAVGLTATCTIEASDDTTATETIGTFPVLAGTTATTVLGTASLLDKTITCSTNRRYYRGKTVLAATGALPTLIQTLDVVSAKRGG